MRSLFLSHIDHEQDRNLRLFAGLLFCVLLTIVATCRAQPNLKPIDLELDGRLWIEGTAGIFDYECNLQHLSNASRITASKDPIATIADSQNVDLTFSFRVTSFRCDKGSINQDLYKALKYKSHPTISFQLTTATSPKDSIIASPSPWMPIETQGVMEMAGVQQNTTFPIEGKVLGKQRYQVKGTKTINMKTYEIDPPSTMGGLVTADKMLDVHFDVTVKVESLNK